MIIVDRRRRNLTEAEALVRTLGGGLDPGEVDELDEASSLTCAERRAVRRQDRAGWQTPNIALLDRPTMSPMRRAGLFTLRGYLVVAVAFVIIKMVQAGVVGPATSL
jgi:hypothetical protein